MVLGETGRGSMGTGIARGVGWVDGWAIGQNGVSRECWIWKSCM